MMVWLARLLALTCHQLPERSPHFAGIVFPVCFRLAGLYFGAFASYASLSLAPRRPVASLRMQLSLVVALVPFLVDGWANTLHLWSSASIVRALTGLAAGIVMPLLLTRRFSVSGTLLGAAAVGSGLLLLLWHPGSLALFGGLATAAAAGFVLLVGHLVLLAASTPRGRAVEAA